MHIWTCSSGKNLCVQICTRHRLRHNLTVHTQNNKKASTPSGAEGSKAIKWPVRLGWSWKNVSAAEPGSGTWENWWNLPIGRMVGGRGEESGNGRSLEATHTRQWREGSEATGLPAWLGLEEFVRAEGEKWRPRRETIFTIGDCFAAMLRPWGQLSPSWERSKLAWRLRRTRQGWDRWGYWSRFDDLGPITSLLWAWIPSPMKIREWTWADVLTG